MTPLELLLSLRSEGRSLRVEADGFGDCKLFVGGGSLTDELSAAIREHKSALLHLLSDENAQPQFEPGRHFHFHDVHEWRTAWARRQGVSDE